MATYDYIFNKKKLWASLVHEMFLFAVSYYGSKGSRVNAQNVFGTKW